MKVAHDEESALKSVARIGRVDTRSKTLEVKDDVPTYYHRSKRYVSKKHGSRYHRGKRSVSRRYGHRGGRKHKSTKRRRRR